MSEARRAAWDAAQLLPRSDVAKNAVLVADLKWNDEDEDDLALALVRARLNSLVLQQRFAGSESVQARSESVRVLSEMVAQSTGGGADEPLLDQSVRQYRLKDSDVLLSEEAGVRDADSVSAVVIYNAAVRKYDEGRRNSDANLRRIAQHSADIHIVLDDVVQDLSKAISAYQIRANDLHDQSDAEGITSEASGALFVQERAVRAVIDQISSLIRDMAQALFDNTQIEKIARDNQFVPPGTPPGQARRMPKLEVVV